MLHLGLTSLVSHGSIIGENSSLPRSPKLEKEINMDTNMCSPRIGKDTTCVCNGTKMDTDMRWQLDRNSCPIMNTVDCLFSIIQKERKILVYVCVMYIL